MLFRPEEVHGASGIGSIFGPFPEWHSHIPHQTLRISPQDLPVADLHLDGLAAVKTGCIDLDYFAREEPADRQRFEPSLAEPFLLPFDGDAVLGGKVVKWGEGGDIVRIRK